MAPPPPIMGSDISSGQVTSEPMNLTRLAPLRNAAVPLFLLRERLAAGVAFNPLSASFRSDPYPVYHMLRAKDPVHWSELAQGWILTRYTDVISVLRDPRFSNQDVLVKTNQR